MDSHSLENILLLLRSAQGRTGFVPPLCCNFLIGILYPIPDSTNILRTNSTPQSLRVFPQNAYWCIPPKENAEFVACMEDILDIYEMPYSPAVPVVCMGEKPYQLLGEARELLAMRPGDTQKMDCEYARNGTCSTFVFVEPLGGIRCVSVREHRTALDWVEEIKYLVGVCYPDRDRIILDMDNLNTHALSSLCKAFPAPEARRITSLYMLLLKKLLNYSISLRRFYSSGSFHRIAYGRASWTSLGRP